ncbi:MAG: TonB-dependent receptor [Mangrovibacterium sp.]
MKLTLVLTMLFLLNANANTYSQGAKLDISIKQATLKELFEQIKSKSDYKFLYNNDMVNDELRIDVNIRGGSIEEILTEPLKRSNLTFKVIDKQIIVYSAAATEKPGNQPQKNMIKGVITDPAGQPLPGATITISGTTRGVITDVDGSYTIEANPGEKLVFSFIGMETETVEVVAQSVINIQMKEKVDELTEVTVVAFGKQKKESVISSIETIRADDLRVPSSNLTTSFAGKMSGLISYQTTGEPGQDNAEFFIRGITSFGTGKVDPLILIDNIEMTTDDLARLHPDDIASFSILKDATGTALYGARAANGVVMVTTKEGKEGKVKVSFRVENNISAPTREIELADPITYMKMANEAAKTRNPLAGDLYSQSKIENTLLGTNPMVYPTTDWMDMLFNDFTMNQKANLNISGGGKVAQYYISGSFTQDNGILKVDHRNNFNNNIDLKKYLIRSNITLNLTNTTKAKVRLHGTFDDYSGPMPGGSALYKAALKVSPTRFPAYYEPDEAHMKLEHILFGNDGNKYINPYAEMVRGYREESKSVMLAQFELEQDFSGWVEGLTARVLGSTTRSSSFDLSRSYNPFYYQIDLYDRIDDTYSLYELNTGEGTEYLSYDPGYKKISTMTYGEASVAYNRTFNKHGLSGMVVFIGRHELTANAESLIESLPERNLGLSGRFTYSYDDRYLSEFNFGYNGSEKFDLGHRWGFFPAMGLGWYVSNEPFWKVGKIKDVISKLKIKGTYGIVGNDEIGTDRFFYLSDVEIGGGGSYTTGYDFGYTKAGLKINHYANSQISWEISHKSNLGIELGLLDGKVDILADLFYERRSNILQTRADISDELGLWDIPQANVGKAKGRGIDASLDYNEIVNDFWFVGRATFTYARSTYSFYEEPDYSNYPWRSKVGYPIKQKWGYVAERLFIDDADIANSPRQDFGEYKPGDIKYKDIDGDGVINEVDLVPIGRPTTPEINYGFGLSAGYKNWDVSFFFQGSARSSFWIDAEAMSPFIYDDGKSTSSVYDDGIETGLAKFIADDYWSESSQNPYAYWPRLSTYQIANNTQSSTYFMQNGSFLRLKSAEIGYSLPKRLTDTLKLVKCRFYVSGTNLLLFSSFDLWDIEMGGNGLGYPIQRVFNLGVNISF